MKLYITLLALIAAALLPTSAYADAERMSAMMYGESGPHCTTATTTVMIVAMDNKADPMEEEVNAAIHGTTDPVLASYYRDLYRAPASYKTMEFVRMTDPYTEAITIALYGPAEPASRLFC